MEGTLVICIGNVARGDDGVAHEVARLLTGSVDARIVTATSLDVTHAEDVAKASEVFVIDAQRREDPLVDFREVDGDTAPYGTHGLQPSALLALASSLYDGRPRMWLVGVAAPSMEHGEGLSAVAGQAALAAATLVRSRIEDAT